MASPKSEQKGDEANHSILAPLPLLRAFHLVITTSGGGGGAKNHGKATARLNLPPSVPPMSRIHGK